MDELIFTVKYTISLLTSTASGRLTSKSDFEELLLILTDLLRMFIK